MRRAINVFCLAGMLLALVPIAVSWATADDSLPLGVGRHVSVIDIMTGTVTSGCPCFLMSATIFAMATVFLLVSPLASLFQIAGIGVFLIGTPFSAGCGGAYCIWFADAGVGLVVAGISAALPLIGMVFPWGVARNFRLTRLKERFITFGLTAE
ncbi:MAG: hypothetical protein KJ672_06425 [Candidatus Thermoplasmatota archaeon]|nr:hypothetical protein [Candidatus Thermoplasmatota archaeon]